MLCLMSLLRFQVSFFSLKETRKPEVSSQTFAEKMDLIWTSVASNAEKQIRDINTFLYGCVKSIKERF
jgi:hypothetical protein